MKIIHFPSDNIIYKNINTNFDEVYFQNFFKFHTSSYDLCLLALCIYVFSYVCRHQPISATETKYRLERLQPGLLEI